MQVLSRQRDVSLIEVRKPGNVGGRPIGCRSNRVDRPRHARGFTLVELMITLVIAVVLVMIAVPSFKSITLSNKLTTSVNDIVNAINVARMEAIKRNTNSQVCSNSSSANSSGSSDLLGGACGTKTGAVYAMSGTAPSQVLSGAKGITSPIQLSGDMTALRFTAQGLGQQVGTTVPYNSTVVDICTSQMSTDNHRKITMAGGSILVTSKYSGSCP